MVKIMENLIKMDDFEFRGTPIFGNTHIHLWMKTQILW